MQEFIELQSKRRLQNNETIVNYMYSKNAVLDKAPYRLVEEERISLILSGIDDNTWANTLAAQLCAIDANSAPWAAFTSTPAKQRQRRDDELFAQQRTANFASTSLVHAIVFQLRRHRSSVPRVQQAQTPATIRADERRSARDNGNRGTGKFRQAHCFLHSTGGTLPVVTGYVNKRPVCVCIDSGANISIIIARALPDDVPTHAWVSRDEIEVLDRSIRPTRAATLHIGLGNTNVLLEVVVVTDCPTESTSFSVWTGDERLTDVTFHKTNYVTMFGGTSGRDVDTRSDTDESGHGTSNGTSANRLIL
ncbi:hypothetical protein HPB50_018979 [Hyalomma asiaticum]|uniref:Uncharacterized protein n=1 Tax=Hyalomma asiaticum TaxID=266040 RepID=A0ACB7RSZ2_HYAAI|nr:hypothetical protein HPB50_018979 [Hyalomma asiaticum]